MAKTVWPKSWHGRAALVILKLARPFSAIGFKLAIHVAKERGKDTRPA